MIELKKITKTYRSSDIETHALRDINLVVGEGEFLAIMGPSGSGKSTLMHVMGFLDKASSGSYFFEGDDVTDKSEEGLAELRNIKIGFVFQAFNLLSRTRVIDNVVLPLIYANVPKAEQYVRAKEVLEKVGLTHRINHYSNQLSGGEKQRVALARALINNPRVIFADEPTGNLDSKSGQAIMELLQELNEQGRTIILVTHETFAAESAKRVIKLTDGVVVDDSLVTNRKITKRDGYSK